MGVITWLLNLVRRFVFGVEPAPMRPAREHTPTASSASSSSAAGAATAAHDAPAPAPANQHTHDHAHDHAHDHTHAHGHAANERPLHDFDSATAHWLVEDEGGLLIDVRSSMEFENGHIEGAVHLPVQEFYARMDDVAEWVGPNKSRPIVVYCASGGRSAAAKEMLMREGYPRVVNLGGIGNW